jgi:GAF domain-containing protein
LAGWKVKGGVLMAWIRQFMVAPVFEDEDKTRVARLLDVILWALVAAVAVFGILSLSGHIRPGRALTGLAAMILVRWGALFLMRRGYVRLVGVLLSSAMWAASTYIVLVTGGLDSSHLITYVIVVLLADLLLGGRAALAFGGLGILAGVGMLYAEMSSLLPQSPPLLDTPASLWAVLSVNLVVAAVLLRLATHSINEALGRSRSNELAQSKANRELQALHVSLEQRMAERTAELERRATQLQVAAEVARVATSTSDLGALLDQAVNLIRERFDLYYVGLFLLDEMGRWAELRAGTGQVGRVMLEQGHRLEVGGNSMVGWCTVYNQARVAPDVSQEALRFDNPLLPNTHSEAAMPLVARGRVIGALDVQSVKQDAFPQEDVMALQTLAGQIAVAIDNARLLAEVQDSLADVQAIQRRYLRQAWAGFTTAHAPVTGYRYTSGNVEPDPDTWLPTMAEAQRQGQVVVATDDDGVSTLNLPLSLRGETIGVLALKKGDDGGWAEEDIAVAQAVTDQVALSLENVRLFDETRRRAQHEALVRELSDRMRRTTDVDIILKTAVQELGQALGAARAFVRLDLPEGWRPSST